MKILLIGKTGQLGGDILRAGVDHEILSPPRDLLDVRDELAVRAVLSEFRPDVVINTAAFHDVPLCETEWAEAFHVNCVAIGKLAAACREIDATFVTFSTDYVFNGAKREPYLEDDRPAPLQVYGITKLSGEYAALSSAPKHSVIVRTCGLYGLTGGDSRGGNFVDKRLLDAAGGGPIEMASEQVVCPTYSGDLARAVFGLIKSGRPAPGVYHLVNSGQCSWYEFTVEIYRRMGLGVRVIPVDRKGLSGGMRRPLYSVLANTKARLQGIELLDWKDALGRYLHAKYGA